MKAVTFDAPGDASVLRVADVPEPPLLPNGVRIGVRATAVNRADLLQRRGLYPAPPGASALLGLECAGEVLECGQHAGPWQVGERVMALLPGGGYAEQVVVDAGSLMPVPEAMSYEEAAAFPEAMLTAFLNIFQLGEACRGHTVLIHGGGSGVGTCGILLCRQAEVACLITAGSAAKCARCIELGAKAAINYREEGFVDAVRTHTQGAGVNVVLDSIGGPYLDDNLSCLAPGGRLVNIGLMGGHTASVNLRLLLTRGLRIMGSTLRGRSLSDKAALVGAFRRRFGAALEAGRLRPVIDTVFPLAKAAAAHRRMESSAHFGKLVLKL